MNEVQIAAKAAIDELLAAAKIQPLKENEAIRFDYAWYPLLCRDGLVLVSDGEPQGAVLKSHESHTGYVGEPCMDGAIFGDGPISAEDATATIRRIVLDPRNVANADGDGGMVRALGGIQ